MFKSGKFRFLSHTTDPPSPQETRSIANKLYERGFNGQKAYLQASALYG